MVNEELTKKERPRWWDWWSGLNWEETRAGVDRESRARVLLLGLTGAGKSTLFNRLCGWTVSPPKPAATDPAEASLHVEDFGLFCLVDLPEEIPPLANYALGLGLGVNLDPGQPLDALGLNGLDPLFLAEGADLLVYLVDGAAGVRAADYRWIGRLRRLGLPLLVALNKSDLLEEAALARLAEIEQRLAITVLPISATKGKSVPTQLLPRMIDACPNLAVALGRELGSFRREAAGRLIGRAAILNGLIALEPLPLIDLPLQMMTLTGLILRLAAVYNRPPTSAHRREIVAAVAGGLAGRYAAQQAVKLVPLAGWLVSGLIGLSTTWLLGQAAVAYFEAGGDLALTKRWLQTQARLGQTWQPLKQGWQRRLIRPWQRWVIRPWRRRPRLQIRWRRRGDP